MKILFEYPYILLTILVLCVLVLGGVGAYFAMQGVRTAKGTAGADFVNSARLKKHYDAFVRNRAQRCMLYIMLSTDRARGLYSSSDIERLETEIAGLFLRRFYTDAGGITVCEEAGYIVLCGWEAAEAKAAIADCITELGQLLLKHKAINVVDYAFGYYCASTTEAEYETALERAKKASMLAQAEHKPFMEWSSAGSKTLEQKIDIENKIEAEIDNNRFFLEYQPVIDAKTKKIVGAEVLARLNSEQEGVLSPGRFLSAVNSVGLNDKFDYYIFEKNCKWVSNRLAQRSAYVYTVNFSRATLCATDFVQKITELIKKYGVPASALAIEILEDESITGAAREQMKENLRTLRAMGFLILLDDFGSGYTTFGDLQNFDISTVKIDRSITKNATTPAGYTILQSVVRTAHELGFKAVCEGIETPEQEAAAVEVGCDMLQGFYYYKPMPVSQLEKIFEEE